MYLAFPLLNQPEAFQLFENLYRKFYVERADFYFKHFNYESPFETYKRHQHLHQPTHFPFIIAIVGDLEIFNQQVRGRNHPWNVLTTFKNGDGTGLPFVEEQIPPINRFSYYSLGSREQENVLMKNETDDFMPSRVFYLLPEDYHYFFALHPYFREHGPSAFRSTARPQTIL